MRIASGEAPPAAAPPPPLVPVENGGPLVAIAAGALTVTAIFWGTDLQILLGVAIYTEQFLCVMLGLALVIGYARAARTAWGRRIDTGLAILSACACGYLAWRYPVLQAEAFFRREEAVAVSLVVMALVIDSARRSTGLPLVLVFFGLFVYALLGPLLSGILQTRVIPFGRLLSYLGLDTAALLGTPLIIATTTVIAFIFFGRVLQAAGGGEFFTDIAAALLGRFRGGSGKVEVVASALFGTISGSAVSNVMSTGIVTIPMMKRAGYRPETAGAVEAVSSTGGQLMPPVMGAAAFLMAENLQLPYTEVAIAAIVPSLLFYWSVFVQVDGEAARDRIRGLDRTALPKARHIMKAGWFFLLPFVFLFSGLFSLNMSAERAAVIAALILVPFGAVVGYRGQRLGLRSFTGALVATGRDSVEIILVCAVAGLVIGVLNITGLAFALTLGLIQVGQGSVLVLLVSVALICIVLGMGLPTTGVYLLVATLAAPPLIELGVPPMAAHMFVFFFGCLSMITPPVALAAFAAANIARASPMAVGFKACKLGWPAFVVPFLFAYSPSLLLAGDTIEVVVAVMTAIAGVWLVSASLSGLLFDALGPARRVLFLVVGAALLVPHTLVPGGYVVDAMGLVLAALLVIAAPRRRSA
ncbi:MAG: TRAP transporter fused permease subunit [Alphaproteobacteria bacterium]|nr:TRAP transporter fused permease subunit [Alphaproteobacteria bacterium]